MIIPKPNLPTSSYTFEKNLMEEMNINFSKHELCLYCDTTINDGKCRNERCQNFNKKLNDHEIEICYFIPLKDQPQQILTGKLMILDVHCADSQNQCLRVTILNKSWKMCKIKSKLHEEGHYKA